MVAYRTRTVVDRTGLFGMSPQVAHTRRIGASAEYNGSVAATAELCKRKWPHILRLARVVSHSETSVSPINVRVSSKPVCDSLTRCYSSTKPTPLIRSHKRATGRDRVKNIYLAANFSAVRLRASFQHAAFRSLYQ